MAMKDAKIKYLEHELEEKERVLEQLREADHAPTPVAEDGRIGTLERRVREIEAVVKGLTEEVLDLKALTLKLVKTAERFEGQATTTRPGAAGRASSTASPPSSAPTVLVRPRNAEKLGPMPSSPSRQPAAADPAPAVSSEGMDLIMQPDGTIKPEMRRKNEYIIAPNGPQNRRQGTRPAGDRTGRHVDAVIFADEQELPRPPKKR